MLNVLFLARNDDKVYVNDGSKDKGFTGGDLERADKKVNGDEYPPIIDHKSGI